jgi:hypothetical protein
MTEACLDPLEVGQWATAVGDATTGDLGGGCAIEQCRTL